MFHSPARPWQRTEPGTYGRTALAAFRRPDQMIFIVYADKVPLMLTDPRKQIAERAKLNLRRCFASYQLLGEKEVVYNRLGGWQIETQTSRGGHDYYFLQWLLVTNGIAYDLTILGTPGAQSKVQGEATRMFANFELTTPRD